MNHDDDPFLTKGDYARPPPARGPMQDDGIVMSAALLTAVPWLIFTVTNCLYAFVYHHDPFAVYLVGTGAMAIGCVFGGLSGRMDGKWYGFLGALCIVAVIFGNLTGLYNYYQHFMPYWAYDEYRTYDNVLPSEPAAAHGDAGKIEFARVAHIDTTKAVGYKVGKTYCVAPVMDETQTSRVEYWAAGIDCCSTRSSFRCDSTSDPSARSGVVILDTGLFKDSNFDYYRRAVKQAEAAYDIVSAPDPLFVRWVSDPVTIQNGYWKSGIAYLISFVAIYWVLSFLLGMGTSIASKRQAGPRPTQMGAAGGGPPAGLIK